MILIKDGRVIDPERGVDDILDIVIDDGVIQNIGKYQRDERYEHIIEASGLVVAPGLVDVHVHFRDPGLTYKEDIDTGAQSAAKGGFTTVVCMANTSPVADNPDTLRDIADKAKKADIRVLAVAAVTKGLQGRELTDMASLLGAGAVGFSDDGMPIKDIALMTEALIRAKELNAVISLHEEEPSLIAQSGINAGVVAQQLKLAGAPAAAEDVLVARDCMLSLYTGARVHLQHLSSKNAVKLVRLAKQMAAPVTAEATPQHFSLCEEAVLECGTLAKVNPPIRTREDRYEIIEGLKDGTIDIIATDHAPHSREEKQRAFGDAPSGVIGLETVLALGITKLVRKGHLTMSDLIEKMSLNPARLYGLNAGRIAQGAPADLVLFDPNKEWVVREDQFFSKSANSPFIGKTLYGLVQYTLCGGKIVYKAR